MSYKGLFFRQYMGQTSVDIPSTSSHWMVSPDLMVYGTAAAYSTSNFNSSDNNYESRNWFFSQAPTPGKPNYIYVRGLSLDANLNSKVYLFFCTQETMLKPKAWKSDTFTVAENGDNPKQQNTFSMTAVSYEQLLTSYDPVNKKGSLITWTPPAGDGSPHYYLIAWVDNSGNDSDAPPFDSLSDFTDEAALKSYVQSNANMAFLDTWYKGIFMRQFSGQKNYQEGTGAQASPDIIVSGITAAQDYSAYSQRAAYDGGKLHQDATQGMRNFVYIRGLNTAIKQQSARVYLYYTTTAQLSPADWRSDGFTVAGQVCNYVDFTTDKDGIVTSPMPIVWSVDSIESSNDYVLIAYVDDRTDPKPPDFSIFGYVNTEMIEQFVATQPRLSWLKVATNSPNPAPDMTYQYPLSIKNGKAYVGLQFSNISTKGTVTFSIPGGDSATTVVQSSMKVPAKNAAVTWPIEFNTDLETSLVLNYWSHGGEDGEKADIESLVVIPKD